MQRSYSLALGALMLVAGAPAMAQQVLPVYSAGGCSTGGTLAGAFFRATRDANGVVDLFVSKIDTGVSAPYTGGSASVLLNARDRSAPVLAATAGGAGNMNYEIQIESRLSDSQVLNLLSSSGRYSAVVQIPVYSRTGSKTRPVEKAVDLSPFFPSLRALRDCRATERPGPTFPPNQKAALSRTPLGVLGSYEAVDEMKRLQGKGIFESAPMSLMIQMPASGPATCRVTRSSGNADVDTAYCNIFRTTKLKPATDAHGKPIAGTISVDVPMARFPARD